MLLLDDGMSCAQISKVLFIDDDTVRQWYRYWIEDGIDGLLSFGFNGRDSFLSCEEQGLVYEWVNQILPCSIRNAIHDRYYGPLREFAKVILTFLRDTVPKNWLQFCNQITDNFRVINPDDFRVLK